MATLGHSGSQAPQLMHSSVIIVATVIFLLIIRVRKKFSEHRFPIWRPATREALARQSPATARRLVKNFQGQPRNIRGGKGPASAVPWQTDCMTPYSFG